MPGTHATVFLQLCIALTKQLCSSSHPLLAQNRYDRFDDFHDWISWYWSGKSGSSDSRLIISKGKINMAEPSYEELKARVQELEKQSQGRKRGALEFKVSEKGGMSVYGLGRFPVTLYYEQWIRLLDQAEPIREFLEANKAGMKLKNPE